MLYIKASPVELAIAEQIFNYVNDDAIWPRHKDDSGYMGGFTYLRVANLLEQQLCVELARDIMLTYREFEVLKMLKSGESQLPLTHTIAYESLWKKGAIDYDGLTNLGVNMLEKFVEVEFGS